MADAKIFSQEVHRRRVKKFPRRHVVVTGVNEIWSMDLAFMDRLADENKGNKFILCIVDVLSKYAWCVPIKNKSAATVLNALKSVIEKSRRKPQKIWVDKGSEFYNKEFKDWAKSNNITIYSTYSESKSVIAESFIKTIKSKIQRYFTETNSRNWVDVLPEIVSDYNNHVHSTIKMTPAQASKPENEVRAYINYMKSHDESKQPKNKFKVGDQVRISRVKGTFEKGYEPNFSYEVFTVKEVLDTNPITYKLVDYHNDPIEGSFYTQELLKTKVPHYYEIEKIIKTRKRGKKKEYLVKFYGWPSKFNEWLDESQISDIKYPQ